MPAQGRLFVSQSKRSSQRQVVLYVMATAHTCPACCSVALLTNIWPYVADLNGSHPARGGLAVIADSHQPLWTPPPGFELTPDRRRFSKKGEATPYNDFDFPGCVPIFSNPGDLIVFAARTYHAAFPVPADFNDVRHSVGLGLRSSHSLQGDFAGDRIDTCPWPIPATAQAVTERVRAESPQLIRYFEGYWGFPLKWAPSPGGQPGSRILKPRL